MPQHSIFGRTALLSRADVETLLERAEDPWPLLDRMVRDYTSAIADAQDAVTHAIGELRVIEADAREAQAAAARWGMVAQTASGLADEMRAAGDKPGAETFDELARAAIGHQIDGERTARLLAGTIADQSALADRLGEGVRQMGTRLEVLHRRHGTMAPALPAAVHDGPVIDILDPASDIGHFEERVRREGARVHDGAPPAAGTQLRLAVTVPPAEIEARLSHLKATAT